MKKIISILIVLLVVLFSSSALAAVDLSSMTYDELVSLHKETLKAIMNSQEFKEVTVPAGKYTIGQHIPSGEYKITTEMLMVTLTVNEYDAIHIITPGSPLGRIILKDGDVIDISMAVVFSPFVGLGF